MASCDQTQEDYRSSSSSAPTTTARNPDLHCGPPCDSSHQADPASVPLPPSPPATMSQVFAPPPTGPNVGPAPAMPGASQNDVEPRVSFEDFATLYHRNQRKQAQRKRLEKRLRATKVSIGVSTRIIRVGNTVQRGLVEALKHDDKASFVALYHMLYDLQESCASRALHEDQPDWDEPEQSSEPRLDQSCDFFHQLSPQSRADLLEFLRLARSDAQFLVDRLRSFTPSQLAAFTSPATTLDLGDPAFPSSSRSRSQYTYNRNPVQSALFKDHVYAFERTDALSILLCNVFAAPLISETAEAHLRLDVWSSVCAQLMSHGSSRFYPLIGQVLSFWAMGSTWKARPKFELYVMDILQSGAFLLEHINTPAGLDFTETLDPLRTDVAEEFFASAVDDLFRLLDDPDGGLPQSVLQFAKAVLKKLDHSDSRDRFLGYLFVQWFFPKFLYNALTYPETHGLLLDFHMRKDAREKLLGQVGLRAYSQVFAVLRSMNHFSILRPTVKKRVDNMLSKFEISGCVSPTADGFSSSSSPTGLPNRHNASPAFLLLSATDVLTLLDALFPRSCSPLHSSPASAGLPSWSPNLPPSLNLHRSDVKPGISRSNHETSPQPASADGSHLSAETSPVYHSGIVLGQAAARIRFELSDPDEPQERARLEYPSDEQWTVFSISKDGRGLIWSLLPDCDPTRLSACDSDGDAPSANLGSEENHEALHTAIVRLARESDVSGLYEYEQSKPMVSASLSLKQGFGEAMVSAHHRADFVGAHYWWNASRQLLQRLPSDSSKVSKDSRILEPMHKSCTRSLNKSQAVIERCENDFVFLDQSLHRLQTQIKELMGIIDRLRNKMWYMTDVKYSMRYEEARHVALALKAMIYSHPSFDVPEDARSRTGARSLGGSLFQKPEVQVMNMMKAPSSQGGPKKLSDEQVDLTRKWLAHNGIENFCKGEERIHRFCYEVRTSINRLVGETMAETPVLWASELFQRERARYEGHGTHAFAGLSVPTTPRPSTTASEDPIHCSPLYGANVPLPESLSWLQDQPSLGRKPSIQSLAFDKSRTPRDLPSIDISSIGGSPGRAASTSTNDTCSTFWSTPQRQPLYAASVSSVYSRPPSMFSETALRQPRRTERKANGKTAFMEDLRQTLTSLLLSDLGSPVWSCGSETDAWFSNTLGQHRVRVQMQRRAAVQRFYSEYDERSKRLREQRRPSGVRRSRSFDSRVLRMSSVSNDGNSSRIEQDSLQEDEQPAFSYKAVFYRLIEVFSRHSNPFVKLNALRDLRSLVVASLVSSHNPSLSGATGPISGGSDMARRNNARIRPRATRHSFSEGRATALSRLEMAQPLSTRPESIASRRSEYSSPSEDQIVATLRGLILEVKPKTLFRDLQFISAFVPGDQLNKSDRGTAFLQFGLAALSLKDEVCNSMVEIADRIVSQELMRRHPLPGSDFHPRPGHAIEDAAAMWIITAKEGNPVAQRELAILYLTHPELLTRVTLPLTRPRDTFKAEMMYRRGKDTKSDPQSMCLALHWMQLSASGGDVLARNRLREREEFDSIA